MPYFLKIYLLDMRMKIESFKSLRRIKEQNKTLNGHAQIVENICIQKLLKYKQYIKFTCMYLSIIRKNIDRQIIQHFIFPVKIIEVTFEIRAIFIKAWGGEEAGVC